MAIDAFATRRSLMVSVAAIAGAIVIAMLRPFDSSEPPAPVALTAPEIVQAPIDVAVDPVEITDVAPATIAPTRDTFFMFPDGYATIAGRTSPNVTVEIVLAGAMLDRVTADANGGFGATVFIAPSDQPRRMELIADPDGDAVPSRETYFVQPTLTATPEAVAAEPAEPLADTAPLVEDTAVAIAAPQVPEGSPQSSVVTQAPEPATAPAVLVADEAGVRVLQPASDLPPEVMPNVALDTITYDAAGDVQLAGRGAGTGFVQVYLDNRPIITSKIDLTGDWQLDLPDVDTGVYTLRIDEVTAAGDVVSRIETPFQREEPAAVAAVFEGETDDASFDVAVRTVQPGATLWAIAREQFGDGIMYVAVFEANRDRIRDPDLIYPGQIFRIPQISE